MGDIQCKVYRSPLGLLKLGVHQEAICLVDWQFRRLRNALDQKMCTRLGARMVERGHPLQELLINQLDQYFARERKEFDLPLKMVGTEFQKRVWQTLLDIPFGQTSHYQKQADLMGNQKSIRAVAAANAAYTLAIVVPCHRIIGRNGGLVGYRVACTSKRNCSKSKGHIHLTRPSFFSRKGTIPNLFSMWCRPDCSSSSKDQTTPHF